MLISARNSKRIAKRPEVPVGEDRSHHNASRYLYAAGRHDAGNSRTEAVIPDPCSGG